MISLDDEAAADYLAEAREHLADMETDLLALEKGGKDIDVECINRLVRAVHLVKAGSGFFDLDKIGALAQRTEDALELMRSRKATPTPHQIRVLLDAIDRLNQLIGNAGASNQADIAEPMAALGGLCVDRDPSVEPANPDSRQGAGLRVLLVEDDFASRLLLQSFLSRYGECHIAVNGREAVEAVRSAMLSGQNYDLICMDIMMPEMDGREAVRQVRALEEAQGILFAHGVKIIMTTAIDDFKEVILCFKELCDAYLVKPIDLAQLLAQMKSYRLIQ